LQLSLIGSRQRAFHRAIDERQRQLSY